MSRVTNRRSNGMRAEYDFGSLKGGVRGKYVRRLRAGTNLVLLEPELAEAFPTDAAVNSALRVVLGAARVIGRKRRLPSKALQPASRARTSKRVPAKSRAARG